METKLLKLEEIEIQKIISISRGKQLPKEERDVGNIVVIGAGKKSPYTTSIANYESNTITISSSGAYAGYVSMHNHPIWASDCTVIEISNEELLNRNYLYLFFLSKQQLIYSFQVGAGQPHVYWKNVKTIQIPLPPLPKQKVIAQKLDLAQRLIDLRKESITKLDDLAKSVFVEMFGDPVENPKHFSIMTLDNFFIDEKNGTKCGPFGSALKKDEYVKNGIPVWNMDNISKQGKFINSLNLMITIEKFNKLKSYQVHNGDIIISRAGTVGKMCVVNSEYNNSIISTNLIRLRLDNSKLLPMYFVNLLTHFKDRLQRLETGSDGALTHMSTKILKLISFPYPPITLQTKFAQTIQKIEAQKSLYEQELVKLEESFEGLLQESFD